MSSSDPRAWVVHKFGGSSVADAQCFERVAAIIESQGSAPVAAPRLAIVLSACKGVTDELLALVALAEQGHPLRHGETPWQPRIAALRARHEAIAATLLK